MTVLGLIEASLVDIGMSATCITNAGADHCLYIRSKNKGWRAAMTYAAMITDWGDSIHIGLAGVYSAGGKYTAHSCDHGLLLDMRDPTTIPQLYDWLLDHRFITDADCARLIHNLQP